MVSQLFPGLPAVCGPRRLRLHELALRIRGPHKRRGRVNQRAESRFAQLQFAKELSILYGRRCPCGQIFGKAQVVFGEPACALIGGQAHHANHAITRLQRQEDERGQAQPSPVGRKCSSFCAVLTRYSSVTEVRRIDLPVASTFPDPLPSRIFW